MIKLSSGPIEPGALFDAFRRSAANAGAVAAFVGVVRGEGEEGVTALELDHAPQLTLREIERAADEARRRWPIIDMAIVHRVGRVGVGEPVVFVATAAEHRRAAFQSCDFLVDFLKTDAPFWKKEIGRSGERWIEPTAKDYADRDRWR